MTPSECENACKWLFKGEVHRSRSQSHKGFLLYPVEGIAKFVQPLPLPAADATNRELMNLVHSCFARNFDIGIGWSAPLPLHVIVARWQDSLDYTLKLTSKRIHSLFIRALFSKISINKLYSCNYILIDSLFFCFKFIRFIWC